MAPSLTAIATAIAPLFLFTISHAYSPLYHPQFQVVSSDRNSVELPGSDPNAGAAIILPSEKLDSEPATFVETEPEKTKPKLNEPETIQEKQEVQTDTLPLTVITFHPINRHFARRPFFPFRRGHNCHGRRHHHFNHLNEFRPRFGQRIDGQPRIPYGNDVVVAKDQDQRFDAVSYGGGQMWNRFNHHGRQFVNNEIMNEEMNNMPQRGSHHQHHDGDSEEGKEKVHRHEHGGIMKGIRKFLGQF